MNLKKRWYEYLPFIGNILYMRRQIHALFLAAIRLPKPEKETVLVLAGNYQQYRNFIQNYNGHIRYKYVSDLRSIRGYGHPTKAITIGTYFERKDVADILEEFRYNGVKVCHYTM